MDRDDVWRAIDDQRRRLTEALEDLSEQEWHHPSLCRGGQCDRWQRTWPSPIAPPRHPVRKSNA